MSHDDLSSWLKVAAENKITIKNTWKSTLINHFTDMTQFTENQGINFQKASSTLDGCVKVYVTRVDDVSEEAIKLLEGFSMDESNRKKSNKKKEHRNLETNLANINVKPNKIKIFRDPTFLSLDNKIENMLLFNVLHIGPDGVFRLYREMVTHDIKMNKTKPDALDLEHRRICPTFTKYKEVKDTQIENIDEVDFVDFDEIENEFCDDIILPETQPVFNPTPFAYFSWAGPSHWRTTTNKQVRSANTKNKEVFYIDFTTDVDIHAIYERDNTLLDPSYISKQKLVRYNLPEDYQLEVEDLYNYNLLQKAVRKDEEECIELSMINEPNIVVEEPLDEVVVGTQYDANTVMPFRREQKKVDIKKLKKNILDKLETKKSSKLSDIFREIPRMYEGKERKDISVHFCIVSLLHVANEQNLNLEIRDNDIVIED